MANMSKVSIARVMGIDPDTLVQYYEAELTLGAERKFAEAQKLLWKSARKGNVSAQKQLVALGEKSIADQILRKDAPKEEVAQAEEHSPNGTPSGYRGKKEMAREAAMTAGQGTDWGNDLLPPGTRPS